MSYYFVAQIKIEDEEEYKKYLDGSDEVFEKFEGKYLAVDTSPQLLEGEWTHDRVVIIEFPDKEKFERWYTSSEYRAILKHRLRAAKCDTVLVKGMEKNNK